MCSFPSPFSCTCMYAYVGADAQAHTCTCSQRSMSGAVHLVLWGTGLKLAKSSRISLARSASASPVLGLEALTTRLSTCRFWGWKSGHHACTAHPRLSEPDPEPCAFRWPLGSFTTGFCCLTEEWLARSSTHFPSPFLFLFLLSCPSSQLLCPLKY